MKNKFGFQKKTKDPTDAIVDDIIDELQEQESVEEVDEATREHKGKMWKKVGIIALVSFSLGVGIVMYDQYCTYTDTVITTISKNSKSDSSSYVAFQKGALKCSRDGVIYMDSKGEEIWNYPCQVRNPMVEICEGTVAIGDCGGTNIFVFDEKGIKGSIQTTNPIQKLSVSEQGIVGVILKNELTQKVVCYDARGQILVEQDTSLSNTGYPLDIAISNDGETVVVPYMNIKGNSILTEVVYYNFGKEGKDKVNHKIMDVKYSDVMIPKVDFLDKKTSVLVGDNKIVFNSGIGRVKPISTIEMNDQIESVECNENGVALIVKKSGKSGNALLLYDCNGRKKLEEEFEGEYSNIKLLDEQVILYEKNQCIIWNHAGVCKYQGEISIEIDEIFPMSRKNEYIVINMDGLHRLMLVR